MWVKRLIGIGILGVSFLTVGCGDKEKEGRSKAQQQEIAALKEQVELLTVRLGTPEKGNPAEDLAKAKGTLNEATRRVEAVSVYPFARYQRNAASALTTSSCTSVQDFGRCQIKMA